MKYAYFILKPLTKKSDHSSRIILLSSSPLKATLFIFLFVRTNDVDSNSFCVNIMIERKQVPEIDFVIASLRQKTFESSLNLSFILV